MIQQTMNRITHTDNSLPILWLIMLVNLFKQQSFRLFQQKAVPFYFHSVHLRC